MPKIQSPKKKKVVFGLPEFLVIFFVVAILAVLALPRIISSRSSTQFAEVKKQIVSMFLGAQKEATIQDTRITFRFDGVNRKIIVYGGRFGGLNDYRNQSFALEADGLGVGDIVYGRPAAASPKALPDGATMTPLSEGVVEVQFQPDGKVTDELNNFQNKALFFYNSKKPSDTAFALSITGKDGQIKIWRYSPAISEYLQ